MFGVGLLEGMMIANMVQRVCGIGCTCSSCQTNVVIVCPPNCNRSCCSNRVRRICLPGCMDTCCYNPYARKCQPGCTLSCCRVVVRCQPGCTLSCCRVVVRCQPGCTLSCCQPNKKMYRKCPTNCTLSCCVKKVNPDVLHQGIVYVLGMNGWVRCTETLTRQKIMGIYLNQIYKLKVKEQIGHPDTFIIKISHDARQDFIALHSHDHCDLAVKIIWAKISLMGFQCNVNDFPQSEVSGLIFKNSLMNGWEARKVTIDTRKGILYSRPQQEKYTTFTINSVSEIWTRFQLISANQFLVIKLKDGLIKRQFGIPIEHAVLWLRAFYTLLKIRFY